MKKLLCVAAALLMLTGCEAYPKRFSATYTDVFDTVTEFTAYCGAEEEFEALSEAVHGELKRLHEIFDIYNSYEGLDNAKTLNDAVGNSVALPEELVGLIDSGIKWHTLSGGRLNIAFGSVLSEWHRCREEGVLPDPELLKELAEHCDISLVETDGNSAALGDPAMSLDFGALAKGYAAQKAAELAESLEGKSFALSVGGNIVTRGEKPSGKWEIGIQDPDGGILTTVKVAGEAVVTSGDYQRYYEVGGVKYHHIIDPNTLYPASLWRSVTVIAENSDDADALSTALFLMPLDEGKALAEKFSAEALWVSPDGTVTRTEGFSDYE